MEVKHHDWVYKNYIITIIAATMVMIILVAIYSLYFRATVNLLPNKTTCIKAIDKETTI